MIRTIMRSLAISSALLACAALAAAAQDSRLASRLDARTATAVTRVLDSARARSLPTEPLVQKALQGAAKRAPSERVVAAVRELMGELTTARAALGARSTEAELVAGAGALHAGVPAATVTRIRSVRGGQSVTVAVGTLADLVARGVPVEAAVNAILALAGRGVADSDFLAFSNQVGRDIAAGAPPAVAARVRAAGAGSGARPATVPGRPDNAPRTGGRRPAGQVPPGRP
ncbi:MAG: hypothetical protein ACR2L6_05580 [Gemmatimonadaceae bacterium]